MIQQEIDLEENQKIIQNFINGVVLYKISPHPKIHSSDLVNGKGCEYIANLKNTVTITLHILLALTEQDKEGIKFNTVSKLFICIII